MPIFSDNACEPAETSADAAATSKRALLLKLKIEGALAFDGDEVIGYLKARARGEKPLRPQLKTIKSLLETVG